MAAAGVPGTLPGPALACCLLSWSRLHGLVSLEVNGQFGLMDVDPALLYEAELDAGSGVRRRDPLTAQGDVGNFRSWLLLS